jgi:hypothetical protein
MGVIGQRHAPAALHRMEGTTGTHCTGGWVGPRVGLDTEARRKILCPCRGLNLYRPIVQSVARHYIDWAAPAPTHTYVHVNELWCSHFSPEDGVNMFLRNVGIYLQVQCVTAQRTSICLLLTLISISYTANMNNVPKIIYLKHSSSSEGPDGRTNELTLSQISTQL